MNATIELLARIYPRHIWLDLASGALPIDLSPRERDDLSLSQVDLDRLCVAPITAWLTSSIDLNVTNIFPSILAGTERRESIARLVNGFNLQIGKTKLVFIPSDAIDLNEFAVPQEWVDLSNWVADYYIPVRVDLTHSCLQLWGFISHRELKQRAQFDRVFRNYLVAAEDTIEELDLLLAACQLHSDGVASDTQMQLASLAQLSPAELDRALQQLRSSQLRLSPRLNLDFSQWGNILNNANYLTKYLNRSTQTPLKIAEIMNQIGTNLDRGWQTIDSFINPSPSPVMLPNFRSHLRQVMNQKIYRGIPLETPAQIQTAIEQLYRAQTELPLPDRINGVEDLCQLIDNSANETIRWKAIEYLWIIDPDHPKLPLRFIRDLGIKFATTDSLALMIAELPLSGSRCAILLRVYPVNRELYLPAGVKLSIFDEDGATVLISEGNPFEAVSRAEPLDSYIQLYFVAEEADCFGVNVILDGQQFTEYLIA
jgi:Protein of unknown function (DUF1822)